MRNDIKLLSVGFLWIPAVLLGIILGIIYTGFYWGIIGMKELMDDWFNNSEAVSEKEGNKFTSIQ